VQTFNIWKYIHWDAPNSVRVQRMDLQMEHDDGRTVAEHTYNSWLPLAEEIKTETQRFRDVVVLLQSTWEDRNPQKRDSTLKWISLIST